MSIKNNQQLFESIKDGSMFDFKQSFESKLKSVLDRRMLSMNEEADRNLALEISISSKSYGGDTIGTVNGVIATEFRNQRAACQYADWLEEQPGVEYYEISARMNDAETGREVDVTDIDLDDIQNEAAYTFVVLAYLYADYTSFTHDIDQDGDVDGDDESFEVSAESVLAQYDIGELEAVMESDQIDELTKQLLGRYIKKAGQHRVNLAGKERDLDDKDTAIQRAKHDSDDESYTALSKAQDALRKQRYKVSDKSQQRAAGISAAVKRLTKESMDAFEQLEESQIDEVMRKIRVSARGLKTIKMQCGHGFKWDHSLDACVKITGAELSVMRKASRHALLTKRSEGTALKVRVKRRIRRAFKFRQMMGLKI